MGFQWAHGGHWAPFGPHGARRIRVTNFNPLQDLQEFPWGREGAVGQHMRTRRFGCVWLSCGMVHCPPGFTWNLFLVFCGKFRWV